MVKLYNNDNYREVVNNNILLYNQNVTEMQMAQTGKKLEILVKVKCLIQVIIPEEKKIFD